jgi:DNA (cytosine-5)-methyltransferase 1
MNHDNNTQKITHISLCSGYEGIGIGLRKVLPNVREIAHVEIETFAIYNLADKMEKGELHQAPIWTDLRTFPFEYFRGKVDIISGGFPCQPFSVAGHQKGVDDPRHLYPHIAEGIRLCKPRIVFLENVEGILRARTHEGEPVVKYVGRTLEEMGYRTEVGIFSASEVGLPHQRKRVFFLGISNSTIERWGRGNSGSEAREQELLQREQEGREVECQTQGCSGEHAQLVNTNDNGLSQSNKTLEEKESKWRTEATTLYGGKDLGNTNCERLQRLTERQNGEGHDPWQTSKWMVTKSPSRPNEQQYKWEAPRVITKGVSESKLGGTDDGFANRVDRLRLLGNGVVPNTAAKAFVTLSKRIIE